MAPSFRTPKMIPDLAEFAGEYIDFMRATGDNAACDALIEYAADYFSHVTVSEPQLRALALMVVDRIYIYASQLTIRDVAVTRYFGQVTRYLLDVVGSRGVRVFYILDNTMRQDRFQLTLDLMFCAGMFVVTPYTTSDTMPYTDVQKALNIELVAGRHVAYIEKDATVNYLEHVVGLARASDRMVFYRNRAPTDLHVDHIPSKGVPGAPF